MAYNELIKNFEKIRMFMRDFYVYGFKNRTEYTAKSTRTYDDEKRRMGSWLGGYMQFRQTEDGKISFISIDSRKVQHNPLYAAWKAKSFTDGDITLHFILMDILHDSSIRFTLNEITDRIDTYLEYFSNPHYFDASTVRKKLNEYVQVGIVVSEKQGRTAYYRRAEEQSMPDALQLDFFSEIAPCGVIGSFLLDRCNNHTDPFTFKHHYINGALDSDVICRLLTAIREQHQIIIETENRKKDRIRESHIVPLQVLVSVQNGRQYLMAYAPRFRRVVPFRIDRIISIREDGIAENYRHLQRTLEHMKPHMWGVSTQSVSGAWMDHVEFTVFYADDEPFIPRRLEREKRCGTVTYPAENLCKFSADVYDAREMIPWIRTFICRITDIYISDSVLENQFKLDLEEMYAMYDLNGGEGNAIQ